MRKVTKHCSEADQYNMLEGHFKLGTLNEYALNEQKIGTLSDRFEGISRSIHSPGFLDYTGSIGNVEMHNVTAITRGGHALDYRIMVDATVFCASVGPHNEHRHSQLRNGTEHYPSNPALTHYIELDYNKFEKAVVELGSLLDFYCFICREIAYNGRDFDINVQLNKQAVSEELRLKMIDRAIFSKPELFSVEQEIRFALIDKSMETRGGPILTKDHGSKICAMLRAAIVGSGRI